MRGLSVGFTFRRRPAIALMTSSARLGTRRTRSLKAAASTSTSVQSGPATAAGGRGAASTSASSPKMPLLDGLEHGLADPQLDAAGADDEHLAARVAGLEDHLTGVDLERAPRRAS
jgi:hypothetical protein